MSLRERSAAGENVRENLKLKFEGILAAAAWRFSTSFINERRRLMWQGTKKGRSWRTLDGSCFARLHRVFISTHTKPNSMFDVFHVIVISSTFLNRRRRREMRFLSQVPNETWNYFSAFRNRVEERWKNLWKKTNHTKWREKKLQKLQKWARLHVLLMEIIVSTKILSFHIKWIRIYSLFSNSMMLKRCKHFAIPSSRPHSLRFERNLAANKSGRHQSVPPGDSFQLVGLVILLSSWRLRTLEHSKLLQCKNPYLKLRCRDLILKIPLQIFAQDELGHEGMHWKWLDSQDESLECEIPISRIKGYINYSENVCKT